MKLSGFSCTYMGESYIYINWGNRKRSARPTSKDKKIEERRKRYDIIRKVHAPEYKEKRREQQSIEKIVPAHLNNVSVNIKNPGEFMNSVQMDRPDFSIENLKRLRQTANKIQRYN